jgi:hypothetical protein
MVLRLDASAAGAGTFDCSASKYDAVIEPSGGSVRPAVSTVSTPRGTVPVTTFTPTASARVIGGDDIAAATTTEVIVEAGAGTAGILVDGPVGFAGGSLLGTNVQELALISGGEVVLGGAVVLDPGQTLRVRANGLEAIDCVVLPLQGNGAHVIGGGLRLDIGALGVGTSSAPHGQVVTNVVAALSLTTAPGARVCLNMEEGGATDTIALGKFSLGGQTDIRLDSAPVSFTRGLAFTSPRASLLIGPNANLCY